MNGTVLSLTRRATLIGWHWIMQMLWVERADRVILSMSADKVSGVFIEKSDVNRLWPHSLTYSVICKSRALGQSWSAVHKAAASRQRTVNGVLRL